MIVVTPLGISEALAMAERAGVLRRELVKTGEALLEEVDQTMEQRQDAVEEAWGPDLEGMLAAFEDLVAAGDQLPGLHNLLAACYEAKRHTDGLVESVHASWEMWARILAIDLEHPMLPDEIREMIAKLGDQRPDPPLHTRVMLRLTHRLPAAHRVEAKLATWDFLHLWGLHALVLLHVAKTEPGIAFTPEALADRRRDAESRVRAFRDRIRAVAGALHGRERATPEFALALWLSVFEAEHWIRESSVTVAEACATATAAVDSGDEHAERLARDAALVYDGVRTLLSLISGARAVLRSYAVHDGDALSDLAVASGLPVSSATLDLPRRSVPEATRAEEGEMVEVAGVVRDATITPGGPQPRSVLVLGAPAGAQLQVFVPFTAVDSFGVKPGVWVQVRGRVFPNGKDDLEGPVLQTRRIRRGAVAGESFFDHLVWAGRGQFELRPQQIDLVCGRRAGEKATAAELGLRR